MALYSNSNNFLLLSKILFPLFFIVLGSCQLDQSISNIKNTLFESDENSEDLDAEKKVSSEKEESLSEINNNFKNSSRKDEKLFTPDKIEDDKRILDFFTSFFSPGDDSDNIRLDELNKEKKQDFSPRSKNLANEIIPEKKKAS